MTDKSQDKPARAASSARHSAQRPAQRPSNIFALNRLSSAQQSTYRRQGSADAKGAKDKRSEVDPVVDKLRAMLDASGMTDRDVARAARLADNTVINIRLGVTRQPKHRTVFAIANACGFDYIFVARGGGGGDGGEDRGGDGDGGNAA